VLAEFSWPGRWRYTLRIEGPSTQLIYDQSLSIDSTYVWFTYQGRPAGTPLPPFSQPGFIPHTLMRINRTTRAITEFPYFFLTTDNIIVNYIGQVSSDDGTKFVACHIVNRKLPDEDNFGFDDRIDRHHPFAYLNPT